MKNLYNNVSGKVFKSISILIFIIILISNALSSSSDNGISKNSTSFIQNKGQLVNDTLAPQNSIKYYITTKNFNIYFQNNSITYLIVKNDDTTKSGIIRNISDEANNELKLCKIEAKFVNFNPDVKITTKGESPDYLNFYYDNCPEGITGVKAYSEIVYENIYDNIDLYVKFEPSGLKTNFLLKPGADYNDIQIEYYGANITLDNNSNLLKFSSDLGEITEQIPVSYVCPELNEDIFKSEMINTLPHVDCKYKFNNNIISFELNEYDNNSYLVIDPLVIWSSYFGGKAADHSFAVKCDKENNIVILGNTLSANFPVTAGTAQTKYAGSFDAYVAKFDTESNRKWATYYGGTSAEYVSDLAVDDSLNIVFVGWTWSRNFPVTENVYQTAYGGSDTDGFIGKLDKNGLRKWASYCGAENNEHIYSVDIFHDTIIGLTGWIESSLMNFPDTAIQRFKSYNADAFIIKLNENGNFRWGTYFGADSVDSGQSCKFLNNGTLVVAGYTKSFKFKMTDNAYQSTIGGENDCFLIMISPDDKLKYSSFLGAKNQDYANYLSISKYQEILLAGYTQSENFPVTQGCYQNKLKGRADGFFMKVDTAGQVVWSSYLGGSKEDNINCITGDKEGNVILIGTTESADIPIPEGNIQDYLNGSGDAIVAKFTPDGITPFWISYFGGTKYEWGNGLIPDTLSNIYITGDTESSDFPSTTNSFQPASAGFLDAFLTKLCKTNAYPVITHNNTLNFCYGDSIVLDAGDKGYIKYYWSNGATTRRITVKKTGAYSVSVIDTNLCDGFSKTVYVQVYDLPVCDIIGNTELCEGDTAVLDAGRFTKYLWSDGSSGRYLLTSKSGKYTVSVQDSNGCKAMDTISVRVSVKPKPKIVGSPSVCYNSLNVEYLSAIVTGNTYSWSVKGGTIVSGNNSFRIFVDWGTDKEGYIELVQTDPKSGCFSIATYTVTINESLKPKIQSNTGKFAICDGDSLLLDAGSGYYSYLWNNKQTTSTITITQAGIYDILVKDEQKCQGRDTVEVFVYKNPQPKISGDTLFCISDQAYTYSTPLNYGNQYLWTVTGAEIISKPDSNSIILKWLEPGTHVIELTEVVNSTNCFGVAAPITVHIIENPVPKITYKGKLEICMGDSIELSVDKDFYKYQWSGGETTKNTIVKKNGWYKVLVTNQYGCQAVDSVQVKVFPNPEKPLIYEQNDTLYCQKYYKYKWFVNGNEVSNDTNMIVPENGSKYIIIGSNEYGCSSVSDEFLYSKSVATAIIGFSDTIFAETNEFIIIPLLIFNSHNLDRVKAKKFYSSFRFNKSILLEDNNYNVLELDKEKIITYEGERNDSSMILAVFDFRTAWGDVECTNIILDSISFDVPVNITKKNGVFCLSNLCQAGGKRLFLSGNELSLSQNKPNPFSSYTKIEFEIIEKGHTKLYIVDLLGNNIVTLFDKDVTAGNYSIDYDDDVLPSGTYIYVLETPSNKFTKIMQKIK